MSQTRRRPNWATTVSGLCMIAAAGIALWAGSGPLFPGFFGLLGAAGTVAGLCGCEMGSGSGGGGIGGGGIGGGDGGGGGCGGGHGGAC